MKRSLLPPNIFLYGVLLIALLYFLFPKYNFINFPYSLSGLVLVVLGFWLVIASWQQFVKNKTPEKFEKSTKLVTDGLYKYSRNPMYVGIILILLGLSLISCKTICFISPLLVFIFLDRITIPLEEQKTAKDLKGDYLLYKRKVRRWI